MVLQTVLGNPQNAVFGVRYEGKLAFFAAVTFGFSFCKYFILTINADKDSLYVFWRNVIEYANCSVSVLFGKLECVQGALECIPNQLNPEFAQAIRSSSLSKVQLPMNHKFLSIAIGFAVAFSAVVPVQAQQPHQPEISIGHSGVETLKADIEYLLSFTSTEEQKQFENIVDFLDLIVFGMDEKRPVRVDILTGTRPPTYVVWGAFEVLADLKSENIEAQFVLKDIDATLSELLPDETGWFRVLPDIKYAILILTSPADHMLMKQIILKLGDPLPGIQSLLTNSANMGLQILNKATMVGDQQKRRDSFAEIRSNHLDALQKRPSESETEFALRKGLVENQLAEIERLMVESLNSSVQMFLNKADANAKVLFASEAIPDTSYAKSLSLFTKKVDAFASVKKPADSVLSIRANHPIDELRQSNVLRIIELMRADTVARLKADQNLSADEKTASQELFDGIMAVVQDGIKSGNINSFVESTIDANGEQIAYGAASTTDGERLASTLAFIAKTGKGNKVTVDVATVGDVSIHEVQLAKGYFDLFDRLFGEGKTVYIGTSKNFTWFSTGEGSLDVLKTAIADLKEPAESDVVLTIESRLLPWVTRTSKLIEESPDPGSLDLQQQRRDVLRSLKLAIESLADKDDTKFELKVVDGKASGEIFVNTGVLRFLGRQIALGSKNNLE